MYLPPQFRSQDEAQARALIRAYPLATLISTDEEGFPFITHLPLHLEALEPAPPAQAGAQAEAAAVGFRLLGHVAKPNPHWRYLQARPALVSFLGPHAYLSPRVYPDLARVPTWNYLAVECKVQARLVEAPEDKDRLLKKLIGDHEPAYAEQWRGLGEAFAHKMLAGIVAFELDVLACTMKIKLNQHRPESHAAMRALYRAGGERERALAFAMAELGLGETPA